MFGYETHATCGHVCDKAQIPEEALEDLLKKQREQLLDCLVGRVQPNKRYVFELRQDYYEDFETGMCGYKAAIFCEEYEKNESPESQQLQGFQRFRPLKKRGVYFRFKRFYF